MKERLVKGANLIDVARLLRSHQKAHPLPELGEWETDLLSRTVAPSTWYSLKVFDSLLQLAHRFVFDGSESSAERMGRLFAESVASTTGDRYFSTEPDQALDRVPQFWKDHFNFGQVNITRVASDDGGHAVQIGVTSYPDMSACHGHVIIGWAVWAAEHAGAKNAAVRVLERPWMHNSALTFVLRWD